MKVSYTKNNTKIYNGYLIANKDLKKEIYKIICNREDKGLLVTRRLESYISETKVHNRLYKLGIAKSHTKDVDLEENIKKWKEIIYLILGR